MKQRTKVPQLKAGHIAASKTKTKFHGVLDSRLHGNDAAALDVAPFDSKK